MGMLRLSALASPLLFLVCMGATPETTDADGLLGRDSPGGYEGHGMPQSLSGPIAHFPFDGSYENAAGTSVGVSTEGDLSFGEGVDGQSLNVRPVDRPSSLSIDSEDLPLGLDDDFSVQFWVRSVADADRRFVLLSQKDFLENSLASQKNAGWVFYSSGGTWAWNMGSDGRRITYERDNGEHMPVNDGRWHQLTMTYSSARSEVRLFFDGRNRVIYKVSDSNGFDFSNDSPMVVGWDRTEADPGPEVLPVIEEGASRLQRLVDAFNGLGLKALDPDELVHLVVDPRQLFEDKVEEQAIRMGAEGASFRENMAQVDWEPIAASEADLMNNPYTVHQVLNFMQTAPLPRVYTLRDGEVLIQREGARRYGEVERLRSPDFDMDDLAIWNRVLSPDEVADSYAERMEAASVDVEETVSSLTAGVWNIWHGGKHRDTQEDGADSRVTIAEILKEEGADVIMMQETYSSGDFIAAELGYYFATTVDWDYLNQGSNISVLSRFPIKEIYVQEDSPFMNVGVKVAVSGTQDMYVMSNWYGMDQFPAVFDFHQERFGESDLIPTLFAGDFNAVPHTDGGDSPASVAMLDAGFTDAYRSLYPDSETHPGPSHRSGRRIDQLYYKGVGLENTSTKLVSTWPTGFPSDHFLILSEFELDFVTR